MAIFQTIMRKKQHYIGGIVIAKTAEMMINYKNMHHTDLTPVRTIYNLLSRDDEYFDDFNFTRLFKVARYLGWNVKRRGDEYFENGIKIR